ncbi:DUF3489 domain-containing protein [Microvirga sp. 2YAF29]|uniref:DUF3489 domain-containing protein n=1 Tax=Microvirga sp. 2YAF29 TaxID=3233031 RepID=UPI003F9DB7C5
MTRMLKLTDTHILLLSAASQRDDGLLDLGARLKGSALKTTAEKLLNCGLTEETPVDLDQPSWRSDEMENRIGLRITATGLQAIGIDPDTETEATLSAPITPIPAADHKLPQPLGETAPRAGSKKATVISLLQRDQGATLDDLISATGWLPHTTRAALTGLRKQGHVLSRSQTQEGKTVYRIASDPVGSAPQVEVVAA